MQILGLIAASSGYRGFVEDNDQYIYFRASSKQVRRVQAYDKAEFDSPAHFIGIMSRFFPVTAFFARPAHITRLSLDELDRIYAQSLK